MPRVRSPRPLLDNLDDPTTDPRPLAPVAEAAPISIADLGTPALPQGLAPQQPSSYPDESQRALNAGSLAVNASANTARATASAAPPAPIPPPPPPVPPATPGPISSTPAASLRMATATPTPTPTPLPEPMPTGAGEPNTPVNYGATVQDVSNRAPLPPPALPYQYPDESGRGMAGLLPLSSAPTPQMVGTQPTAVNPIQRAQGAAAAPRAAAGLQKPFAGDFRVTTTFGEQAPALWKNPGGHPGIDYGTPVGTPVLAAGEGTVTAVGVDGNYGQRVVIRHPNGQETIYGHLLSANVQSGSQVAAGQPIGRSGGMPGSPGAGLSTGPHLHFEVRQNGQPVDPSGFFVGAGQPAVAPTGGPTEQMPHPTNAWPTNVDAHRADSRAKAEAAARAAGIDPAIFAAQMARESGNYDPDIMSGARRSSAGATGPAQLMPIHWKAVRSAQNPGQAGNPLNPDDAYKYAAGLMAGFLKQYDGDWPKALAAYNAGPGAVKQYGGVPPFGETQTYVRDILGQAASRQPTQPVTPASPPPTPTNAAAPSLPERTRQVASGFAWTMAQREATQRITDQKNALQNLINSGQMTVEQAQSHMDFVLKREEDYLMTRPLGGATSSHQTLTGLPEETEQPQYYGRTGGHDIPPPDTYGGILTTPPPRRGEAEAAAARRANEEFAQKYPELAALQAEQANQPRLNPLAPEIGRLAGEAVGGLPVVPPAEARLFGVNQVPTVKESLTWLNENVKQPFQGLIDLSASQSGMSADGEVMQGQGTVQQAQEANRQRQQMYQAVRQGTLPVDYLKARYASMPEAAKQMLPSNFLADPGLLAAGVATEGLAPVLGLGMAITRLPSELRDLNEAVGLAREMAARHAATPLSPVIGPAGDAAAVSLASRLGQAASMVRSTATELNQIRQLLPLYRTMQRERAAASGIGQLTERAGQGFNPQAGARVRPLADILRETGGPITPAEEAEIAAQATRAEAQARQEAGAATQALEGVIDLPGAIALGGRTVGEVAVEAAPLAQRANLARRIIDAVARAGTAAGFSGPGTTTPTPPGYRSVTLGMSLGAPPPSEGQRSRPFAELTSDFIQAEARAVISGDRADLAAASEARRTVQQADLAQGNDQDAVDARLHSLEQQARRLAQSGRVPSPATATETGQPDVTVRFRRGTADIPWSTRSSTAEPGATYKASGTYVGDDHFVYAAGDRDGTYNVYNLRTGEQRGGFDKQAAAAQWAADQIKGGPAPERPTAAPLPSQAPEHGAAAPAGPVPDYSTAERYVSQVPGGLRRGYAELRLAWVRAGRTGPEPPAVGLTSKSAQQIRTRIDSLTKGLAAEPQQAASPAPPQGVPEHLQPVQAPMTKAHDFERRYREAPVTLALVREGERLGWTPAELRALRQEARARRGPRSKGLGNVSQAEALDVWSRGASAEAPLAQKIAKHRELVEIELADGADPYPELAQDYPDLAQKYGIEQPAAAAQEAMSNAGTTAAGAEPGGLSAAQPGAPAGTGPDRYAGAAPAGVQEAGAGAATEPAAAAEGGGVPEAGGKSPEQRDVDRTGLGGGDPAGPVGAAGRLAQVSPASPSGAHDLQMDAAEIARVAAASPTVRADANLDALETLVSLYRDGRPGRSTPAEQLALSLFSGWGDSGFNPMFPRDDYMRQRQDASWQERERRLLRLAEELKTYLGEDVARALARSRLNAHYTPPHIVDAMYGIASWLGIHNLSQVRLLEPAAGSGRFVGLMPVELAARSERTLVELDKATGAILRELFPNSTVYGGVGYEQAPIADNSQDLIITNVPFGDYGMSDPALLKRGAFSNLSIHNQYLVKNNDKLRPGGVQIIITSHHTMDAPTMMRFRAQLAASADLIGAIRLPEKAFRDTDVATDILVLQKRAPGQQPNGIPWAETQTLSLPAGSPDWPSYQQYNVDQSVNQYFVDHPEMALGEHSSRGKMNAKDLYTLEARPGENLHTALMDAISKLEPNVLTDLAHIDDEPRISGSRDMTGAREGSWVVQDGELLQKERGLLVRREISPEQDTRIRAMLEVRDAARRLHAAELGAATDAELAPLRDELNRSYDNFYGMFGPLNLKANTDLMKMDPDGPWLRGLEKWSKERSAEYRKKGFAPGPAHRDAIKADFFRRRVSKGEDADRRIASPTDALLVALNDVGRLDFEYMGSLLGRPGALVRNDLARSGLIFRNPTGGWETADQYLSGDVRGKLRAAELAAQQNEAYQANVEALTVVQPPDLPPSQIPVKLGAHWIPASDVNAFVREITGYYRRGGEFFRYVAQSGRWIQEVAPWFNDFNRGLMEDRWGTPSMNALEIVADLLNNKTIEVTERVDGKPVVLGKPTEAARAKAEEVQQEFAQWVWRDPERSARLHRYYNDNFNNIRNVEADGSHLTLLGMAPEWAGKARSLQLNAIWRGIRDGVVGVYHGVGFGKTLTIVAMGMEMKRLGLSPKNLYVVPKITHAQFREQFRQYYPNANVLFPEEDDFAGANLPVFLSRIAANDWDAVILSDSQFDRMPFSEQMQTKFVQEELDELEGALRQMEEVGGENIKKSPSYKEIQKALVRADKQMKDLQHAIESREVARTLTFDQLGVSMMFVDEAHRYKNLRFRSSLEGVKGLGTAVNGKGAQRAWKMYQATRWMQDTHGGRGVVFATGTPVTNTLAEVWTMMRFLQHRQLVERGLEHFDSWMNTYGRVTADWEQTVQGTYKVTNRLREVVGLPELSRLWQLTVDIRTPVETPVLTDLQPRVIEDSPGARTVIRAEPDELYKEYLRDIIRRVAALDPRRPDLDNMLSITTDGRKASIDMRLVDPKAPVNPQGKLAKLVETLVDVYHQEAADKGTQAVFLDMGVPKASDKDDPAESAEDVELEETAEEKATSRSLYAWIKDMLAQQGIPAEEIAFIQEANTPGKRVTLLDKFNRGDLRFLLGTTASMSMGLNIQERLAAMHMLSPDWTPDMLRQKEGRGIRPGNVVYGPTLDDEGNVLDKGRGIKIFRYVTQGADEVNSFDAYGWGLLDTKARSFDAAVRRDVTVRSVEDVSAGALGADVAVSIATNNPDYLTLQKLTAELLKLSFVKSAHNDAVIHARQEVARIPGQIQEREEEATRRQQDLAHLNANSPKGQIALTVGGQTFSKREDAGNALIGTLPATMMSGQVTEPVAVYRGFQVQWRKAPPLGTLRKDAYDLILTGPSGERYDTNYVERDELNANGILTRLDTPLNNIEGRITYAREQNARQARELETYKKQAVAESPVEARLARLEAERERLQRKISGMEVEELPPEEEEGQVPPTGVEEAAPELLSVEPGPETQPLPPAAPAYTDEQLDSLGTGGEPIAPAIGNAPTIGTQEPEVTTAPESEQVQQPTLPAAEPPAPPSAEPQVEPTLAGGVPAEPSPITPEAEALLEKVADGGVPAIITRRIVKIAEDNGIPVNDKTTPHEIVQGLEAKVREQLPKAEAPAEELPSAGRKTPLRLSWNQGDVFPDLQRPNEYYSFVPPAEGELQGTYTEVHGAPVDIPRFEDRDLFLHPGVAGRHGKPYQVSEGMTGLAIGDGGNSPEEAIAEARDVLDSMGTGQVGQQKFFGQLAEFRRIFGVTPRYEQPAAGVAAGAPPAPPQEPPAGGPPTAGGAGEPEPVPAQPAAGRPLRPGARPQAIPETPAPSQGPIARSEEDLPQLPQGYVRVVHITNPRTVPGILANGLNYVGGISSTTQAWSDARAASFSVMDSRFNVSGNVAVVLDMPAQEYRRHDQLGPAPGVVDPGWIVGVVPLREAGGVPQPHPVEVQNLLRQDAQQLQQQADEAMAAEAGAGVEGTEAIPLGPQGSTGGPAGTGAAGVGQPGQEYTFAAHVRLSAGTDSDLADLLDKLRIIRPEAVRSTEAALAAARQRILADPRGGDGVYARIMGTRAQDITEDDIFDGLVLIDFMASQQSVLRQRADYAGADDLLTKARDLTGKLAVKGLHAGREVQAFSGWERLSPVTQLMSYTRSLMNAAGKYDPKTGKYEHQGQVAGHLAGIVEDRAKATYDGKLKQANDEIARMQKELADLNEQIANAQKGAAQTARGQKGGGKAARAETKASTRLRRTLANRLKYLIDQGRAPGRAPTVPNEDLRVFDRMMTLAQETGWLAPMSEGLAFIQEAEDIARMPKEFRGPAIHDLAERLRAPGSFLEILEERAQDFRNLARVEKAVNELESWKAASARLAGPHEGAAKPGILRRIPTLTTGEQVILDELVKTANETGFLLPHADGKALADALDLIRNMPDSPMRDQATRDLVRTIGDTYLPSLYQERDRLREERKAAEQRAANLRYLIDKAERETKPRLKKDYQEAVTVARANAKAGKIDMPVALAQAFLDRADLVKKLPEGSPERYLGWRQLMADAAAIVPHNQLLLALNLFNLPRMLMTMWDFSAALNQGRIQALAHPVRWAQAWMPMVQSFADARFAAEMDANIHTSPNFPYYQKMDLRIIPRNPESHLLDSEDQWIGRAGLPDRNTVMRYVGSAAWEDAYIGMLNALRTGLADDYLAKMQRNGNMLSDRELRDLGHLINASTGYGNLPDALKTLSFIGSHILFSSRAKVAMFERPLQMTRAALSFVPGAQRVAPNYTYSYRVAWEVGKTYAAYYTLIAAALAGLAAAGATVQLEPTATDFMQVKVGPLRWSPLGEEATLLRTLARLHAGGYRTSTGSFQHQTMAEVIGSYFQGQLHPIAGWALDQAMQQDAIGRQVNLGQPAPSGGLIGGMEQASRLAGRAISPLYRATGQINDNEVLSGIPLRQWLGGGGAFTEAALSHLIPMVAQSFVQGVGDNLGAAWNTLNVEGNFVGMRINAQQTLMDVRNDMARSLYPNDPKVQRQGYAGVNVGDQREIDAMPTVADKIAEQYGPESGRVPDVEQTSIAAGVLYRSGEQRLSAATEGVLPTLKNFPDVAKEIKAFKDARYKLAQDTIASPEVQQYRQENRAIPDLRIEDVLAEKYWSAQPGTKPDGSMDWKARDSLRQQTIDEARTMGVDPNYIMGSGPKTYRGDRFKEYPHLKAYVESYEEFQEMAKPLFEERDRILQQIPVLQQMIDQADAAARSGNQRLSDALWNSNALHSYEQMLKIYRLNHPQVQHAGELLGYWKPILPTDLGVGQAPVQPGALAATAGRP